MDKLRRENERLGRLIETYRMANASQLTRLIDQSLIEIQVKELKAKLKGYEDSE